MNGRHAAAVGGLPFLLLVSLLHELMPVGSNKQDFHSSGRLRLVYRSPQCPLLGLRLSIRVRTRSDFKHGLSVCPSFSRLLLLLLIVGVMHRFGHAAG